MNMRKLIVVGLVLAGLWVAAGWVRGSFYQVGWYEEPVVGTYTSDELCFLKTFYLVNRGENFYSAFKAGMEGVEEEKKLSGNVWLWRWPTAWYLWSLVADNGWQLLRWFWFLMGLTLISGYLVVRKYAGWMWALVGLGLMGFYLADVAGYRNSWLFTEWWGWMFWMLGLGLWVYGMKFGAWGVWALAILTRELMVIPVVVCLVIALLFKKERLMWGSILGVWLVMCWLHMRGVGGVMGERSGVSLAMVLSKVHGFDKVALMKMVAFGMRRLPLVRYGSQWWVMGVAFLGGVMAVGRNRYLISNIKYQISKMHRKNEKLKKSDQEVEDNIILRALRQAQGKLGVEKSSCGRGFRFSTSSNSRDVGLGYLLASAWSLFLVLPFISSSQLVDYWGITFMPTVLLSVGLLGVLYNPQV
jgi:hypothetical protein